MLLRKHLDVFCTGALPLLAGYQVPVYKQKDAERYFFFEQRYWLSAMKVSNIQDYQKKERNRYWDVIKHDFSWVMTILVGRRVTTAGISFCHS